MFPVRWLRGSHPYQPRRMRIVCDINSGIYAPPRNAGRARKSPRVTQYGAKEGTGTSWGTIANPPASHCDQWATV